MNRKIKFRAWDKCKKRMLEISRINFISNAVFYKEDLQHVGNIGDHCCVLMQFTGLTDKNRKEIFEGDIVRTLTKGVYYITYDKGRFLLFKENFGEMARQSLLEYYSQNDLEVIGNIFENPDLLKDKT